MLKRKTYLLIAVLGLLIMGFGQFMARPKFYGTELGRAWAHVFWLGFLLLAGSLITWFTNYIAHHKNPLVVTTGKIQVVGMTGITGLIGLMTIIAIVLGNNVLIEHDGDGRKGVFVLWLLLLIVFTAANVSLLLFRQLKRAE